MRPLTPLHHVSLCHRSFASWGRGCLPHPGGWVGNRARAGTQGGWRSPAVCSPRGPESPELRVDSQHGRRHEDRRGCVQGVWAGEGGVGTKRFCPHCLSLAWPLRTPPPPPPPPPPAPPPPPPPPPPHDGFQRVALPPYPPSKGARQGQEGLYVEGFGGGGLISPSRPSGISDVTPLPPPSTAVHHRHPPPQQTRRRWAARARPTSRATKRAGRPNRA